MSEQNQSACPLESLTGTYVSTSNCSPSIPTTILTIRKAPGNSASGTSKWTGADGKSHIGELQGEVGALGDGQTGPRSIWHGSCRIDGDAAGFPFVLVASDDGKQLLGAYWRQDGTGGTWNFAAQ